MSRVYLLLLTLCLCGALYSCKKDKGINIPDESSASYSLIVGRWLAVKAHIKIYTQEGVFVKDTTADITNTRDNAAWYEVYNGDKTGYKIYLMTGSNTPLSDTSLNYRYSISGSKLSLLPKQEAAFNESIVALDSTTMELEDTYVSIIQNPDWGLNPMIAYKFITDTYYKKQ